MVRIFTLPWRRSELRRYAFTGAKVSGARPVVHTASPRQVAIVQADIFPNNTGPIVCTSLTAAKYGCREVKGFYFRSISFVEVNFFGTKQTKLLVVRLRVVAVDVSIQVWLMIQSFFVLKQLKYIFCQSGAYNIFQEQLNRCGEIV